MMRSPRAHQSRPTRRAAAILWAAAFVWLALFRSDADALDLDTQRKLVNQAVIGVLGDGARGTDFALIADLAIVLDQGYDRRILPMAGTGSVRAIEDVLLLNEVDIAIVQADVLNYYKKADLFPDIGGKLRYLTKLYSKEIHLLASRDIGSIEDLEGRKVNFGPPSSGSFLTASLAFKTLGISVEAGDDDYQVALDKLKRGDIDAWVRVDAKPSLQMENLSPADNLHFLPLPRSAIGEPYVRAELTSDDYPELIRGEEVIETLAVPTVMAVYAWPKEHRKRAELLNVYNGMIERLERLQQGPFHAKWREVDPGTAVAGWERF